MFDWFRHLFMIITVIIIQKHLNPFTQFSDAQQRYGELPHVRWNHFIIVKHPELLVMFDLDAIGGTLKSHPLSSDADIDDVITTTDRGTIYVLRFRTEISSPKSGEDVWGGSSGTDLLPQITALLHFPYSPISPVLKFPPIGFAKMVLRDPKGFWGI